MESVIAVPLFTFLISYPVMHLVQEAPSDVHSRQFDVQFGGFAVHTESGVEELPSESAAVYPSAHLVQEAPLEVHSRQLGIF